MDSKIIKEIDGVEIRTEGKEKHGTSKKYNSQPKYDICYTENARGYKVIQEGIDCENHQIRMHRLQAVAKYGFDEIEGMDVHHKNGKKWDNRFENIELIDPNEHSRLHALGNDNSKKYDRSDLKKALKKAVIELGKKPTTAEYRNLEFSPKPSPATFRYRIGSWTKAKEELLP